MESLYILVPIAFMFVILAVTAFLWAVKTDQFDDLEKEAHSILFDEIDPSIVEPNRQTGNHDDHG